MQNNPTGKQPKEASGFAKGIAFLLALLFVLTLPFALLMFDVWRVVFNPPLVKAFITDEVVNSDLIPVALEWFSERRAQERVETGEALTGVDEPDIVLLLSYMNRDDWKAIKSEILTSEFMTHVVSVTVDGTYAWIDSTDRVPQITWDLGPFLDRVNSEHGVNAIQIAYDKLPPCTQEEINDFLARVAAVPPGVEVLYNLCEFPDPWHDDQFSDYVNALYQVTENVPREFALTEELSRVADQGGVGPEAIKEQLRLIRLLSSLAWLVPLALLLLILALVVRSLRTLSRWWGVPFIAAGLLALLPALTYRLIITNILAVGALSETPEVIIQEATRVILRLASEIFSPLLIQAAIILLLGVLLVVWYAVKSRQTAKAAPAMK